MKSVLMIGMGRFGHHLCKNMAELGNEIMIIDENEKAIEDLAGDITGALIGDCTNPEVLKSLGIDNYDICFVCIGSNFQSSLEITSQLKELGAKYVVSKANRDIHAKFLLRNGADEVIYPDRDIAEKVAKKFTSDNVFDYIELTDDYSVYEIPPLPKWAGKTITESEIRPKYKISILGIKHNDGRVTMLPPADYEISADDHLMVIGSAGDVEKLLKQL
ncbi:Ktr system potassium uptake protein A [Clostridiales bacterium]|nr:Ktr system potassium uptake protein A [Clostridiales bacterium]